MEIKQGSSRFVIILGCFVFKFPKIMVWVCLKDVFFIIKKDRRWKHLKFYLSRTCYSKDFPGLRYYLLNGIISNFKEYLFWLKYKNNFCEPTFFSLLGFVNIQRFSPPYNLLNKKDFWLKIRMVQNYDWDDGHHFCNSNNFNIRDGKILIVDYASSKTQRVILKHGQNIIRHFSVL
ncbi:hypothetical protein A2442_00310 [Candidatus Campbellbacteria bacterium RIFOXYC2_FULL_35_25]|uniref:Uncharacterized protein n=1 Tax=Candidatus Campbellbacteria bacterium RIFOXYC2_FULL_35_25 TaxID=1797582 RepID=A0A1F5EI52_9BACT|nr:MAG: hypothetical protein A2442_00310 [Candidatus Campbellbacteria bacterium RIFOXYC2_FULL_35_25]